MTITDPRMNEARFLAAVDMARRTGAVEFQIRYDEEQLPVVWVAVTCHIVNGSGMPQPSGTKGTRVWSAGCGLVPLDAVHQLCEKLIDGGMCFHCKRPSGFDPNETHQLTSSAGDPFCWTAWDPELKTYRRGCRGDE